MFVHAAIVAAVSRRKRTTASTHGAFNGQNVVIVADRQWRTNGEASSYVNKAK